ncbi:TPA: NAD-dependent isocitrate dehydrogenase [bacterium]|nr:NAD-dependent isocitrate dehydrogenase [bacterium]
MKVTLIKGDGIGPEVISSACKVINAVCPDIEYDEVGVELKDDEPVIEPIISSVKKNKIGLKGPITTPIGSGFRSINVSLRKELSLYAGVRPAKSYDKDIDIVVIRENTEGLYTGIEYPVGNDAFCAVRVITKDACNKIVHFAFEYARKNKRKKVTAIHKANILKLTCGLFLDTARNIALDYPDIEFEDKLIDNTCMQLAKKPNVFDVIVTTNLFGDIISDLCAGLIGGLGVASGANIGDECAVFEPVHGSCPKYAGLNQANPIATILSGAMMLKYIGKNKEAEKIENAIISLLKKGVKTKDLGGNYTCSQMTDEIINELQI